MDVPPPDHVRNARNLCSARRLAQRRWMRAALRKTATSPAPTETQRFTSSCHPIVAWAHRQCGSRKSHFAVLVALFTEILEKKIEALTVCVRNKLELTRDRVASASAMTVWIQWQMQGTAKENRTRFTFPSFENFCLRHKGLYASGLSIPFPTQPQPLSLAFV